MKLASISAFSLRLARLREGKIGEVAGQANARAHHDVALGAGAPQPLAGGFRQVVKSHECRVLRAQQVSQPRGFLIVFTADGLAQPGAQPEPLRRRPRAAALSCPRGGWRRDTAARATVSPLEKTAVVLRDSPAGRRPGIP